MDIHSAFTATSGRLQAFSFGRLAMIAFGIVPVCGSTAITSHPSLPSVFNFLDNSVKASKVSQIYSHCTWGITPPSAPAVPAPACRLRDTIPWHLPLTSSETTRWYGHRDSSGHLEA